MERSLGASAVGLLPSTPGTHDTCDRALRGDDIMAELARGLHPRERPDWEETISAMARSAEVPDFRTSSNTASMKVKSVKKLSFSKGHFPKLAECAHFHYENVDFGNLQLSLADEHSEITRNGLETKECVYLVQIHCQGRNWIVRRSYEDFRILDKHLHLCIYDRRYSQLPELPREQPEMLIGYLTRLSAIADNKINCGPALTWMELDNKGNHLLVHEESSINVPAIAAAHVIKRYNAQASDELSFEVGDIVSVIDMPPKEDTTWWRGKHGFQVGFFPSECVELINDKIPQSVNSCVSKPASPGLRPASWYLFPPYLEMETVKQQDTNMNSVSKKHGKLITFLRTFMKSRPSKQKLKQRGILKERVFACDLGEHLLNSGQDVPQVLRSCAEFIEKHGIVDGIYRLSGIASNIQKLRHEFDSEIIPDLTRDVYIQDIHCVGSLCKLYFRELPNPLLTYQLYEKFSDAVSAATDDERLIKIHDVIQQLPPPHYRTLEFLMKHLSSLATCSSITNMHAKNLAIVWAPNLLRSRQIESACFGGPAAFLEVRIQSVVVEFILSHVDVLFGAKLTGHSSLSRPKSLLLGGLSARLLSLEEAQARTQAQISSPVTPHSRYIEVGEGPAALLGKFHTVIDFPTERKRQPIKSRKSPVGSWRSFFSLGKSSSSSSSSSSSALNKRKLRRNPSEPSELKSMALTGGRGETGTLRSAKSEESLTSLHNVEGESKLYRPRRPRSSSDALSSSFGAALLASQQHCASYDNLCNSSQHDHEHDDRDHDDSDHDDRPIFCVPALISSPPIATETDLELMPPEVGMATLDFDPMSFGLASPLLSERETALISTATEERKEDARSSAAPQSPDRTRGALDFFFAPLHPSSSSSSSVVTAPPPSVETPPLSPPPPLGAEAESAHNEALLLDLQRASPLHIVTMETDIIRQPADLSIATESELQKPLVLPLPALSCPPAPRKLQFVLEELEEQEPPLPVTPRCRDTPSPLSPLRADDLLSSLDWPTPPSLGVAVATLRSASPAKPTDRPTVAMVPDSPVDNHHAQPQPSAAPANDTAASVGSPAQATPTRHQTTPTARQAPPALSQAPLALNQTTPAMTTPTETTPTQATPTQVKSTPVSSGPASPPSSPVRQPMAVDPAPAPAFAAAAPTPAAALGVTAPPCSAVAPSSSSRERGCVSPPRPEPHPTAPVPVQTLPHAPLRPSEHPVPVQTLPHAPLRPSEHPVAVLQPQPQTPKPQPSARALPPSLEKPWEAIKPVQPRMETAPYQHFHQHPPPGPAPPPPPPVRSIESKLATAALSREDSAAYHAFLEEEPPLSHTLPRKSAYVYHAQGEHVLLDPAADAYYPPHPRVVPLGPASLGYQYRADPLPLGYASDVSRYATIGPRSYHHSLKSQRPTRAEYLPSPGTASLHRSHGYAHESAAYPSIRRVHSLHTPTVVRGPPVSRTEVPPPDEEMFYYQRSAHRCHGYLPAEAQDYHVTRLQPFFENGRVQYRYSPYSEQHALDGPCYDLDPYGTMRLHHFHSFGGRDHEGAGGRVKSGAYHYLLHQRHAAHTPHHHHAGGVKEHGFVSRDMPPAHLHTPKGGGCLAWDPQEEAERLRVHSLRRESRTRQKVRGPVLSQYDNIGPYMPSNPRGPSGPDALQNLCSKSDPGNEARYNVTPETAMPRSLTADPDALPYMETEKHAHTYAHTHTHTHTHTGPKAPGPRPYPSPQPHGLQHLPDASRPEDPPESRRGGRRPEDDPLPKPERSHSRGPPPEPDAYPRPSRHTSSTQSHYDNLDDYGPLPRPPPQDPLSSRGGPALFPGQAFIHPTRGRAYSTALGQGAFLQTDPPLQRVEAEVKAE
ncbi:rho GTPase-activating protein 32 isoform X3 [Clupea harengus]|uniref:Rho GTPase-activating protein 32 isoform X3 n=1 Tax=Clupea harengus TaxID=7950 RepID=A0A6P8FMM4_CLUHA|nr:rho GTPase-activating protein 32 isoform X3 [Clupea harengus]